MKEWCKQNLWFLLPVWRFCWTVWNRFRQLCLDVRYLLTWLLLELPRGLDFSRRDTSPGKKSGGEMSAYQKTSRRRIRQILSHLDNTEGYAFLDIGCGKGYVLKNMARLGGFSKLGGIEYDHRLAGICRKNLSRLGLNHVCVWEGDARSFEDYGNYDTFFFYNPFGPQIFREVLDRLPSRGTHIIYFNPVCHQIILDSGRFHLVEQLYDGRSKCPTNIYASAE